MNTAWSDGILVPVHEQSHIDKEWLLLIYWAALHKLLDFVSVLVLEIIRSFILAYLNPQALGKNVSEFMSSTATHKFAPNNCSLKHFERYMLDLVQMRCDLEMEHINILHYHCHITSFLVKPWDTEAWVIIGWFAQGS